MGIMDNASNKNKWIQEEWISELNVEFLLVNFIFVMDNLYFIMNFILNSLFILFSVHFLSICHSCSAGMHIDF